MTATPDALPTSRRSKVGLDATSSMEKPSTPDNLTTALLAASVNFGSLEKDAENPFFKGRYLSLGALLNAVRPALSDQGVLITSRYLLVPQGWVVETTLIHAPSGTMMSSQFPVTETETVYGPPDQYGKVKQVGATGNQKVGAAGTFGMRYNLLQLLGIAAADDDGNSAAGLAAPDDFLGPPPGGQQRAEPRRMPDPNRLTDPNVQPSRPDWL